MGDEPENVVLTYLRCMDGQLDLLSADILNLKVRMTTVEADLGGPDIGLAGLKGRVDRIEGRLDRIEKRLYLVAAP